MAFEEEKNVEQYGHLVELNDSDYEIVDGEPDIEGWEVKDDQGTLIGEVMDLLFDPESRKVRYIIVELDEDFYEDENEVENDVETDDDIETDTDGDYIDERTVLIPIGVAELIPEDEEVYLPGVTAYQINALPLYEKDALTPATEASIRNIFEGKTTGDVVIADQYNANGFYDHDHFDEDKFYNRNITPAQVEPMEYNNVPTVEKESHVVTEDPAYNHEKQNEGFAPEKETGEKNDGNPVI